MSKETPDIQKLAHFSLTLVSKKIIKRELENISKFTKVTFQKLQKNV